MRIKSNLQFMRILCVSACLLFFFGYSHAQKYSNDFLTIGVGAKGHGMGSAQAASVDDVTAGYWNPAGLVHVKENLQLSVMHAEWYAGVGKYDYFSGVYPIINDSAKVNKRVLGFSFIRLGVDNIPNTLSLYEADGTINYNNITPFSAADYAFLFSYAQPFIVDNLFLGGNVKLVHRKVGPFASAWGFGIDIGAQYYLKDFRFGAVAKDLTGTFNAWNFNFTDDEKQVLQLSDNEIPESSVEVSKPTLVLGAAYVKRFNNKFGFQSELDLNITTDRKRNVLFSGNPISIDPAIGIQGDYNDIVYLRAGLNNFQRATDADGNKNILLQPNLGIGVKVFSVKLDYAMTNIGYQSEKRYSHVISMIINIDFEYFRRAIKNAE